MITTYENPKSLASAEPTREAAFFFGLFLRGYPAEELRQDINVSNTVLHRWQKNWRHEPHARSLHENMLRYRQQVLAIFDSLIQQEQQVSHLRQ